MRQNAILIASQAENVLATCKKLHNYGMDIFYAEDIDSIKAGLTMHSPAFILLDFDIEGIEFFLAEMNFDGSFFQPYVMVASTYIDGTARAAMLERGADACVSKPINIKEILAVINATLRREQYNLLFQRNDGPSNIRYKELTVDAVRRLVTMKGKQIILTRKEFDVLCYLAQHIGTALTKERIYSAVWNDKYDFKSTNVSDQISSLRRKLGLNKKDVDYIETVVGIGYRFGTFEV